MLHLGGDSWACPTPLCPALSTRMFPRGYIIINCLLMNLAELSAQINKHRAARLELVLLWGGK